MGEALLHLLTATMKGMVALSGLEAMSNGIQFVINEDAGFVKWGKKHLPRLKALWHFYSGKSGIGRVVQTSFLFYGGLGTLFLTFFALRFNVFDGTAGPHAGRQSGLHRLRANPGRRCLVLGLSNSGGGVAGGGVDDGVPGCAGHRMARCRDRRDSRVHRVSRSARHLHPIGHHHLWIGGVYHVSGARRNDQGGAVLWRGRLHADHGDGAGHSPAYQTALYGSRAHLGCVAAQPLRRYWLRWCSSVRSSASGTKAVGSC